MTNKRAHLFAVGTLALITLWIFHYLLTADPGHVVSFRFSDLDMEYYPWRHFATEAFRSGHLPLWNPYTFFGSPFLANPETALLYPPNWVHAVLPLDTAINFLVGAHVFLAGLNFYIWMSYRRLHAFSAVVAATCFMLSGPVMCHVWAGHMSNLASMAWAPLIFLAVDGVFTPQRKSFCLLGIAAITLQILAGHTQYLFFTGLIAGLYMFLKMIDSRERLRSLAAFIIMYAWAAAIAAAQLFTTAAASSETSRAAAMDFSAATLFSLAPENLFTLLVPNFFGNIDQYWGRNFYWEMCFFVGLAGLIVGVYGFSVAEKKLRVVGGISIAVCVLLALGKHTPLYELGYNFIPLLDHFRGPSKFIFQASLFLALFIGVGIDASLKTEVPKQKRWAIVCAFIALALFALAAWVGTQRQSWREFMHWVFSSSEVLIGAKMQSSQLVTDSARYATTQTLFAAIAAAALAGLFWLGHRHRLLKYGIGVLVMLDVIGFAGQGAYTFEPIGAGERQAQKVMAGFAKDDRVLWNYVDNAPMKVGLMGTWGYASLEPLRGEAYFRALTQNRGLPLSDDVFKAGEPYLSLTRTRAVIGSHGFLINDKSLGRFQFVRHWQSAENAAMAMAQIGSGNFDPRQTVILETPPSIAPEPVAEDADTHVEVKNETSDDVELTFDLKSAAILVVTDAYAKGWRARAFNDSSQNRYDVMPADGVIRAIPVAAGHHHFVMEYRPEAFVIGSWVSIAALVLFLGAIAIVSKGSVMNLGKKKTQAG